MEQRRGAWSLKSRHFRTFIRSWRRRLETFFVWLPRASLRIFLGTFTLSVHSLSKELSSLTSTEPPHNQLSSDMIVYNSRRDAVHPHAHSYAQLGSISDLPLIFDNTQSSPK